MQSRADHLERLVTLVKRVATLKGRVVVPLAKSNVARVASIFGLLEVSNDGLVVGDRWTSWYVLL